MLRVGTLLPTAGPIHVHTEARQIRSSQVESFGDNCTYTFSHPHKQHLDSLNVGELAVGETWVSVFLTDSFKANPL